MAIGMKAAWEATKELAGAVGTIASLTAKLKASPDKAAADLADALDQVTKTHRAVADAVTKYLGLADDPHAFDNGIKPLLEISGGVLSAEIEAGLGHCHEIVVAYDRHLHKWFARVLDPTEALLMKGAFDALGQADFGLFKKLATVGEGLDEGANDAIQRFHSEGEGAARARLKDDFVELFALRSELANSLKALRAMQNEFRVLATGVPMGHE
jgi:hypothetical protein